MSYKNKNKCESLCSCNISVQHTVLEKVPSKKALPGPKNLTLVLVKDKCNIFFISCSSH